MNSHFMLLIAEIFTLVGLLAVFYDVFLPGGARPVDTKSGIGCSHRGICKGAERRRPRSIRGRLVDTR